MKLIKPVFAISRRADSLEAELNKTPGIVTVWIRSGKYKDKFPLLRTSITFQATSTEGALDYKKRYVSSFSFSKTHSKLSVLKGISKTQITQLLNYTRKDKFIRSRTHDFDHFRSKKTFLSWKRRGKTIYTLIDRKAKLFAMIWFAKGVRFIRIYPSGRGKNVSKKFSDVVRSDFRRGAVT